MVLLSVVVLLFFGKVLFTTQFSILLSYEGANQRYAWGHFAAATIQQGVLPLWDPLTFSGRSFVGEMQTGLFYPPKLLLYLWPLGQSGLLSTRLVHVLYVLAHLLGAWFMFLLARELGLNGFAAFVASVCFSLGGFVGTLGWLHLLDSAIWLPFIFLFLIRALRAPVPGRGILYACLCGVGLGMAILAGGLHVVLMEVLAVASAAVYSALRKRGSAEPSSGERSAWTWSAVVLVVVGVVTLASGAIQLLPSMEYSELAVRYLGEGPPVPAAEKLPYARLAETHRFLPRSWLGFLLVFPFGDPSLGTSEVHPYFGILPLLLVIIGVWRNWEKPWVKYLTGLAVAAFFYSLGSFSFLHGLLYALVPYLWMAREAGRFIYLAHFAMAILAGFGAQTIFSEEALAQGPLAGLTRLLKWSLFVIAVTVGVPVLYGEPKILDRNYFSFLLIIGAYGLFAYILRGHRARTAQFFALALIGCDLQAFNFTMENRSLKQKAGTDYLEALLGCRNLADFFKSQPGLFRIQMQMDWAPNIGNLFGVGTSWGTAATVLRDYERFALTAPRATELLNVRYVVRAEPAGEGKPVYADGAWWVYENHSYCPRAWIVHHAVIEPSKEKARELMGQLDFDPLRTAVVSAALEAELETAAADLREEVIFERYQAGRLELRVRAQTRGLLVLSEVDYPGWRATVNGRPARIHQVNGLLRGVVAPAGESRVSFRYAPRSILAGAALTGAAFLGTLLFAAVLWVREQGARA